MDGVSKALKKFGREAVCYFRKKFGFRPTNGIF